MFISSLILFADKAMIHDLLANFQVDYAFVITITDVVVSSFAKLLIHLVCISYITRLSIFCQALACTYSSSMLVNASFFYL